MSIGDITATVIAITGLLGAGSAYVLGKRGQKNDEKQQSAATNLQERISAFDELESLNDRLTTENARLRELCTEAESRGDFRLAAQARRCREVLEQHIETMTDLRSVVRSEIASAAAESANERTKRHLADDHPES